jgi:tape measure domain-containing protein
MSNLGTITYQVEVETAALVTGTEKADKQLDKLDTALNKLDGSANGATRAVGGTGAALNTTGASAADAGKKIDGAGSSLKVVETSAGGAGKAINKVGTDLKQTSSEIDKATSSSSKFSFALSPLASAISGLVSVAALVSLQKLSEQFTLLESRVVRLSGSAADAKTNYAALIQISSAGGSDLTTTIKLWESLTASLKSLGVTKDQILSLTDTLQKIGKIGGSSAEEISAALRQFSQSVAGGTLRAEEFNSIIEQMPELGRKIADGLGIPFNELRQQMLDGKLTIDRVLEAIYKQTGKVNEEFDKVPRSVGAATNAIINSMGVAISKIDQAAGASRALAAALDAVANGIRLSSGQLTDQQQLNKLVLERATAEEQYATQIKFGLTTTAAATKARLEGLNKEIQAIQDRKIAEQKAESDKLKITPPKNAPKTDSQKAIDKLKEEADAAKLTGEEKAKLIAIQKLGDKATAEEKAQAASLGAEIYKLDTATKELTASKKKGIAETSAAAKKANAEAKKAATEERKGVEENQKAFQKLGVELAKVGQSAREVAQDQAQLSLNKYATPEQIQSIRDIAGAFYDAKTAKDTLARVDPAANATQAYTQQLKDLQTVNDMKLLSDTDYLALKEQAETDYNARMMEIETQRFAAQSAGNQALIDGLDALGSAGTQALGGLLSGTMSLQDALGNIANTVLNAVIGSFVQAGIEWVKQQIVMASVGQATAAAATAASVGEAGIVAAAWAPAAAMASLASFGTNSVPAAAALTSTTALASGLALVGGRALGGPVQADGMYRVNETGAPEIFNAANGRQYMMPNSRGDVVSNNDATSGGGAGAAPIINVHNYSGQQASSTAKFSEADRRWVIDTIVGDMMGDGKTGRAVNQTTGTRKQGV